jgi:GxxExxY protein
MTKGWLVEEKLTHSFFEYNELGYGFLEHIYLAALERELLARGHTVAREFGVPVMYKGEELGYQRPDMIVDGKVVIEGKSTQELHAAATRQILSYLRATSLEVGFLLHFGPEPKFFRLVNQKNRAHPLNPRHPRETMSEGPARGTSRKKRSQPLKYPRQIRCLGQHWQNVIRTKPRHSTQRISDRIVFRIQ